MFSQFIIALREGLEAALIVGIILVFLAKTGAKHKYKQVYAGIGVAVALSIAFALVFEFVGVLVTEGASTQAAEAFEGFATLIAAGLLITMIVWMERKGPTLKQELEEKVSSAISGSSLRGVFIIVMVAVLREGVETVLFILAPSGNPVDISLGVSLGFAAAIAIAYAYFSLGKRINLRTFFRVTSVVLVLFAAGMIAYGVHELQEAGIIPIINEHVWNINNILDENSPLGQILKGLVGYNGNPSLIEVTVYVSFLVGIIIFYVVRRMRYQAPLPAGIAESHNLVPPGN